jgi:hypothetical protein
MVFQLPGPAFSLSSPELRWPDDSAGVVTGADRHIFSIERVHANGQVRAMPFDRTDRNINHRAGGEAFAELCRPEAGKSIL